MNRLLALIYLSLLIFAPALAQTEIPRRYVTSAGLYGNDGKSWTTAKGNIQDAINDLQDYMQRNGLETGYVFVGAGTYVPTESTESSNDGIHYTSFKIPPGVHVYGGFTATGLKDGKTGSGGSSDYQSKPSDRYMKNGLTQDANDALIDDPDVTDYLEQHSNQWAMRDLTLLSGDHSVGATHSGYLSWNSTKQQYEMAYSGNSYHVVWFATQGFIPTDDDSKKNRAVPLDKNRPAVLDGCTVTGGYASTSITSPRDHTSFGGGVYMVDNSVLRHCIVTENAATRRGGGVYCDGGGLVEYCHIYRNQSLGQGLSDGFGGGVALDHYGVVRLSLITENCARIGGGINVDMERGVYPDSEVGGQYYRNAFASITAGCLVADNTAVTEAGGMAMLEGGTASHMTVVRNHCAGDIVTTGQKRYGRAGGLFIDTGATFFNSVVWGNTTKSNGSVQFASYVPSTANVGAEVVPYISFSAFSSLDDAVWTGSSTNGVIALQSGNARTAPERKTLDLYPAFANPGEIPAVAGVECVPDGGISSKKYIQDWIPSNYSDLLARGIGLRDYITNRSSDISDAFLAASLTGRRFAPVTTLGAFIGEPMKVLPADGIASVENDGETVKTIFVDPDFHGAQPSAAALAAAQAAGTEGMAGDSWDNPVTFIGDAIDYASGASGIVQILVKEGTVPVHSRPVNFNASTASARKRLRDLSAELTGSMRLYGGFFGDLTGTDLDHVGTGASRVETPRNPREYQTILSGNVTGLTYDDNVAHVVTIDKNADGVVLDGFKIDGGNSEYDDQLLSGHEWYPDTSDGAGILIDGAKNTQIRNCILSNCTTVSSPTATGADARGAALFATGANNLTLSNIIVHNNTGATPTAGTPSAIYLLGCTGTVKMDHSLMRGNVGGIILDKTTLALTNSAFHANGTAALKNVLVESGSVTASKILTVSLANGGSLTGSHHILCDAGLSLPGLASGTDYKALLTYQLKNNANFTYPKFVNPTKGIGAQTDGDVTVYGNVPNFTPNNMNPMVNAADPGVIGTDLTAVVTRNYGGAPDVGPLENTDLPASGDVIYVRTPAYGGSDDISHDGLSWSAAVATIARAQELAATNNATQIWVAAGTYYGTRQVHEKFYYTISTRNKIYDHSWFRLTEGVSMYGGFTPKGNPGKTDPLERDISNSKSGFTTTLCAGELQADGTTVVNTGWNYNKLNTGKDGRVLYHTGGTKPTEIEGFVITNGFLQGAGGAGIYLQANGSVKNCRIEKNTSNYPGTGIYMAGGTVKNCIIRQNEMHKYFVVDGYPSALRYTGMNGGAGLYMHDENCQLINSLVVDNTCIDIDNNILGAGVFAPKGKFYNCTIAYNFGDGKGLGSPSKRYNLSSEAQCGKKAIAGGVWTSSESEFYNCILWGNAGNGSTGENFVQIGQSGWSEEGGSNGNLYQCYLSTYITYTSGLGSKVTLAQVNPEEYYITHKDAAQNTKPEDNGGIKMYGEFLRECDKYMPFKDRVNYELKPLAYVKVPGTTGEIKQDAAGNYYFEATLTADEELPKSQYCINKGGSEDVLASLDITEDISGADRIQDCTVDKGAYEYDGTRDIEPTVDGTDAVYFVSEKGGGVASAKDAGNSACWQKLQKVLDAAGRYKAEHPTHSVTVRLTGFDGYAPTREVIYGDFGTPLSNSSSNPRNYSIMVPRGVTVEGGWTMPAFESRDIIDNPTTLTGSFSYDRQTVNAYHVVSFTRIVYDEEGDPIHILDGDGNPLLDDDGNYVFKTLDADCGRAVLDGLFIKNGDATGQNVTFQRSTQEVADAYWPGNYGGGAIVPSYAHIRNCVIENNNASYGGGALFLKPQALVSGCIIRNNTSQYNGGAIAVYEPGTAELADIASRAGAAVDPAADLSLPAIFGPLEPYANIFTSTIVGNSAKNSGGGVHFTKNLRMNSSVLWRNSANANANLAGQYAPATGAAADMKPWQYPLQFCAVENLRAAGYNNISLDTRSALGARWDWEGTGSDDALLADTDFFYTLKRYSMLTRGGMSQTDWASIVNGTSYTDDSGTHEVSYFPTLETADIGGTSRTKYPDNVYIEIGARVYDGNALVAPDPSILMKRIYVAMPEDTDIELAEAMQQCGNDYYQQPGSSMAYPMNRLGDALEYVRNVRSEAFTKYHATYGTDDERTAARTAAQELADTRIEIFVARGTHYPFRTIKGSYSNTRANTFLVPEGVAIYGGVDHTARTMGLDGYLNTTATVAGQPASIAKANTTDILAARQSHDINRNGISEGWEFLNQTVLSGDVVNSDIEDNVFHVVTSIAAEEYVGLLPSSPDASGTWTGESHFQTGSQIILDGLQICDGYAFGYDPAVQSTSTYYKGGGILVDGNWTTGQQDAEGNWTDTHRETGLAGYSDYTLGTKAGMDNHTATRNVRGYRNIPLLLRNCLLTNNTASYGGALSTNGSLEIYSSQLAQNRAIMNEETISMGDGPYRMTYNGRGGAVEACGSTVAVNTIFANNSAVSPTDLDDIDRKRANGTGGAIMVGRHGALSILNCDIVRNEATAYPAIYTFNLNQGGTLEADNPIKIVNTIFWGNSNIHPESHAASNHAFHLVLNPYLNEPDSGYAGNVDSCPEALWFCAYEDGKWRTPVSSGTDALGHRAMEYSDGTTAKHMYIPNVIAKQLGEDYRSHNFNLTISQENNDTYGPNFISPSPTPGYSGYVPSADWMLGRINSLVDQGWTFLHQTITNGVAEFTPVQDTEGNDVYGNGVYFFVREKLNEAPDNVSNTPMLYEPYQRYSDDALPTPLYRISLDPNPSHFQTYIDIGAYEYQHVQLTEASVNLVDILWVTPVERQDVGVSDGSTPEKATSDLQRAIETLLTSRNGHDKEIRLIKGDYYPVYTIGDNLAFTISTSTLDSYAVVPDEGEYGVKSLTIRGGYDENGYFDFVNNASRLTMESRNGVTDNLLQHILIIENTENRISKQSGTSVISSSSGKVIPITIEAVHFSNPSSTYHTEDDAVYKCPGGAAINYKRQSGLAAPENGLPKLTVKNCKFYNNGAEPATGTPAASTLSIAQGGGRALIFNSLFNDNRGRSLVASATDVVNCTFANNGGNLILDSSSKLYNSILWQNGGVEIGSFTSSLSDPDYKFNIINATDPDPDKIPDANIRNNAINLADVPDGNSSLGDLNTDIASGPNFVNPAEMNYATNPGKIVTNGGSTSLYQTVVLGTLNSAETDIAAGYEAYPTIVTSTMSADGKTVFHTPNYILYRDLSGNTRLFDSAIDMGAYESLSNVRRIMYVVPNKSTDGSGTDWIDAYSRSQLQTAIDAAATFSATHNHQPAYVFVKGFNDNQMETVNMRDGVQLYGSIQSDFNRVVADELPAASQENPSDDDIQTAIEAYIPKMRNDPDRAMAGSSTRRSVIKGITASEAGMSGILDGFEIRPEDVNGIYVAAEQTSPVVDIDEAVDGVVIRNCIIHDFDMADDASLVSLRGKSLLYNTLVRDIAGSGKPVVDVTNADSYVVNCTLAATENASLIQTPATANDVNNLKYTGLPTDALSPFAPYFQEKDLLYHNDLNFADLTSNRNLWYQLAEQSTQMDQGTFTDYPSSGLWIKDYIDFKADRDILGNPRMINFGDNLSQDDSNKIDLGCFETWSTGTPGSAVVLHPNTEPTLYGGNYYPHEGSVVYIQQKGAIVLGSNAEGIYFDRDQVFRPGFLLLREGGSLYGQGNSVQMSYLSVQRLLSNRYALVSLPFDFALSTTAGTYTTFANIRYQGSGIVVDEPFTTSTAKAYYYDGLARSNSDYTFNDTDSRCWTPIPADTVIPANKGWLLDLGEDWTEGIVRFYGFGDRATDWIYSEGNVPGTVEPGDPAPVPSVDLIQYDDKVWEGEPGFTSQYNMGWNLVGLPLLISNYYTAAKGTETDYALWHPHILYTLNHTTGAYNVPMDSWTSGSAVSVGDAFFTQTATLDATETLTFDVPTYSAGGGLGVRRLVMASAGESCDNMELRPSEDGSLRYMFGRDGVKLTPLAEAPLQVYLVGDSQARMALMASAPMGVDIPVGVLARDEIEFQFELPEPEIWEGEVWLIDRLLGTQTDLVNEPYEAKVAGGETLDRFYIHLGHIAIDTPHRTERKIYTPDGYLDIHDLTPGTLVTVYDVSGRVYFRETVDESELHLHYSPGTYIVTTP